VSVALHGNLKDFGIAEVFQLIGHQAKTGVLEISSEGQTARLRFDAGSVVDATPLASSEHGALAELLVRCGLLTRERVAELDRESQASATPLPALLAASGEVDSTDLEVVSRLLTRETIFAILRWSGGSFHFKAQPVLHDLPPARLLGAEQILMDGLRMVDEWRTFLADVPSEEVVFRRAGPFELHRAKCAGEARHRLPEAERVFLLVDGRLSVRRVIDLSRLGTFEATRLLVELRRSGAIEAVDPANVRRVRSARAGAAAAVPHVGVGLASTFALALLAILALQLRGGAPVVAPAAGFPLPGSAAVLELATARFEKLALRNAAQAFRYAKGRWPESLEELERSEWWPANRSALAAPGVGTYYYARRGDGILLLAPERR
jgi:hypothetical protein